VRTEDRPGGESRQFLVAVGLVKRPVRHAKPAAALEAAIEMTFIGNAADDQVRMGQVGWKEKPGSLDGRMTGLDDLLGVRQVMPHEEVNIWCFVALRKAHGSLL
jgi:hypothetical protein